MGESYRNISKNADLGLGCGDKGGKALKYLQDGHRIAMKRLVKGDSEEDSAIR